jgi:hypothetical protein
LKLLEGFLVQDHIFFEHLLLEILDGVKIDMVDFHSLEKRLEVVLDVPVILFNGAMPDVSPRYRHRKIYGKPTFIDYHRNSCPNLGDADTCWKF